MAVVGVRSYGGLDICTAYNLETVHMIVSIRLAVCVRSQFAQL